MGECFLSINLKYIYHAGWSGNCRGAENKMVIKLDEILKYLEYANTKLTEVSADLEKQDADDLTEKL